MATKICSSCKTSRSIDLFFKNKNRKDGLYPSCKICETERDKVRHNNKKQQALTNIVEAINEVVPKSTKICKHCKIDKEFNQFYKEKRNKDGYREKCKDCYKPSNNIEKIQELPTETLPIISTHDINFFDDLESKWL